MMWLKQSTATTLVLGPFVDETDGKTAETGLTISQADVRLSKNAAAFAQKGDTGSCTHMENGYYACALNSTDTGTLGRLLVGVHEAGALPVWQAFMVLPANTYDSLFGSDRLQVHVDEMTAGIITASVLAADAITAAKLAADVTTELQSGRPSAGQIADAVWDEGLAAHSALGSAAEALTVAATNGSPPTTAQIADAVWDEGLAAHSALGSAGEALTNAGTAGDPWSASLPGSYVSGKAGYIIGTFLDQKVSLTNQSPGNGAIQFTYTLTEETTGDPIAAADVWVTSDSAGNTVVASGQTNAAGVVTFYLDAGTVYLWRQKSGWNFTNPDMETVA